MRDFAFRNLLQRSVEPKIFASKIKRLRFKCFSNLIVWSAKGYAVGMGLFGNFE